MKKVLFSIATLGLVTFSAIWADAQNLYIGARIGANVANQLNDSLTAATGPGVTTGSHAGFLAGLQVDQHLSDMWGISGELLYDQKGMHENYNESGTFFLPPNTTGPFSQTGSTDFTLNYLEAALLLKVRFFSGDLRPYIFAGPSVGLFLSGKQQDNFTVIIDGTETVDTTRSIGENTFDVSIVGGAGVELKLGSGHIVFIDAAYAYGFTNIAQNTDPVEWIKSRDIRLAAGILFPLD
ncbi:MAG TPA: porin family protein [Candidatus Kapabacteria bacterium]|jgi:hypothetical protein